MRSSLFILFGAALIAGLFGPFAPPGFAAPRPKSAACPLISQDSNRTVKNSGVAAKDSNLTSRDSMRVSDSMRISDSLSSAAVRASGLRDRRLEPGIFDMITNLPSDWRDYTVENVKFKYWPMMSVIAASTVAMVIYDNQMWQPFKKEYERNKTWHDASDMFVFMGDGKFQFGLAGIFGAYGLVASDKRALRTCSQTCEVILACGGVVQLLKHLTGRESPIVSTTPTGRWQLFPNQIEYAEHVPHYDAFPSGHLATASATLTVIANNYPEQRWIRPVGYAALAGIAVGLVSTSIHWWSDYPLALALGIGFGNLLSPDPDKDVSVVADPPKKDMGATTPFYDKLWSNTTIVPSYMEGGMGVAMMVKF